MILFCATEAGGARELIPIVHRASKEGINHLVLSSPVTEPLFADAGIATNEAIVETIENAKEVLESIAARTVITGTTATMKPDRIFIAAGKERGITTIAVLDEWYNYRLRFEDEHGNLDTYVPDIICVQDEKSKRLAIEEGLPEKHLIITGSPALKELTEKAEQLQSDPPPLPAPWEGEAIRILFLSEPLKNAYGEKEGQQGIHGAFLGFQEEIVREDIADVTDTDTAVSIIEKLHPSEEKKDPPLNADQWTVLEGATPLLPLLWHADIIIGMCSKTLLEAAVLGKRAISYQPNAKEPEKCTAVRLGFIPLCTSKENLQDMLQTKDSLKNSPIHLQCVEGDSVGNILDLRQKP